MALMKQFRESISAPTPLTVVDVGSYDMNGSYRCLFEGWSYTGIDVRPGPNVDIVVDEDGQWSDVPGNIDLFISGQAFEHMRQPWTIIQTMEKRLRPGGQMCIIAPNTWHEHREPIDCWRIFPDGMKALFDWANLHTIRCEAIGPDTIGVASKKHQ